MLTALIIGAIAAALAVASAGASASFFADILATWRRALVREIDDEAVLAAGEAQLDVLEAAAAELARHTFARTVELAAVHGRYRSSLADYDAVIDAMVSELYVDQTAIVDGVGELRATIGDETYLRIMSKIEAGLRKAQAKRERR